MRGEEKMIIGLSGKIGTGKTYLTNYFLEKHPEYTKIGFADILKKECSEMFCYPNEWNYSEDGKKEVVHDNRFPQWFMTVREILQWYGTDVCRAVDTNYWVKKMTKIIEPFFEDIFPDVIIDDVRFINEANLIQNMNGKVIRLNPYPGWKPGLYANHESERNLDDYENFDLILNPQFGQLESCLPQIEKLLK